MTAASLVKSGARNGLQPVDLARHLGGLAELVELCFGNELEAGARGIIREMKWLSRAGPLLRLLPLLPGQQTWNLGYVWVEDGRVIGSVSTQRAAPRSRTWLVANVAVHPDHRRRGIARQLMQATLDHIRGQDGAEAILQVDDDNLGAISLYRQLGFARVTTRMNWTRPGYAAPPAYEPAPVDIRLRERGEWAAQYGLARRVTPEGLAWSKPLREADFRTTPLAFLDHLVTGRYVEHWVAQAPPTPPAPLPKREGGDIVGSITVNTGTADGDRLQLLVHPDWRGKLERPLLARGLRRLGRRPWVARLEYDAEDGETAQVLRDLGFQGGRMLRWMRAELR